MLPALTATGGQTRLGRRGKCRHYQHPAEDHCEKDGKAAPHYLLSVTHYWEASNNATELGKLLLRLDLAFQRRWLLPIVDYLGASSSEPTKRFDLLLRSKVQCNGSHRGERIASTIGWKCLPSRPADALHSNSCSVLRKHTRTQDFNLRRVNEPSISENRSVPFMGGANCCDARKGFRAEHQTRFTSSHRRACSRHG